jgi:hypothetical protein
VRTAGLISLLTLCACTPAKEAPTACLTADIEAVNFGDVRPFEVAREPHVFTNQLDMPLSVDVFGPEAPFGVLDGTLNRVSRLTFPAHGSAQLRLQFAPIDEALTHLGTLTLALNPKPAGAGKCGNLVLALSGRGAGRVTIEPLDFGFVPIGAEKTLELTIRNSSSEDVSCNTLQAQLPAPFGTTTSGFLVRAHDALIVPITVRPTEPVVSRFDQLATTLGPIAAHLRVVAGVPIAELDRTRIEIPDVDFQPTQQPVPVAAVREVHLRNVGSPGAPEARVTPTSPFLTFEDRDGGVGRGEVQIASGNFFTAPLAAGESTTLWVHVVPTSVGPFEQRVNFFTNDPAHPKLTVTVVATAVTLPPCELFVTPPLSTVVGGTNSPLILDGGVGTVTLRNVGAERCVIDSPHLLVHPGDEYVIRDGGFEQFSLAPGAAHDFDLAVTGTPAFDADLRFTVFGPNGQEVTIPLQR